MKSLLQHRLSILTAALLVSWLPQQSRAQQISDNLEPYQMLRSLQFVQDSVVMGDHSAGEMQRFMLGTIDKRLRTINPKVFEDPRNVDAALIYAMSGGNPATLEFLVARDTSGNFDTRVADALRKYLSGRGLMVANSLAAMVPEYKDQRIGPYIALVAGNVMIAKDTKQALGFFDWARLVAPGTIVEEAALRRSVAIAVEGDQVEQAMGYSRRYARRFVHSPYAGQFADLFVQLVIKHYGKVSADDIAGTLEFMDDDRAQEVYLRIARQATINGNSDLAALAAGKAKERGKDRASPGGSVAKLYSGVADLSKGHIDGVLETLNAIPEDGLKAQDQALRAAAQRVAEEVVRSPTEASLEQDASANIANQISAEQTSALPGHDAAGKTPAEMGSATGKAQTLDPDFKTFVDRGRSRLSAIDDLLKQEK
ncbi:chemotaxis protein MotC [Rhizobium sp. FY34]|uniref:chemotaxis protein MotC n=1 Tax=Rhizobium sp. FY34 TaxID=2562309 RepID=UPI0010BFA3BE|nr:chemotaxis protein MotC [Rhizobium sp. FY34]